MTVGPSPTSPPRWARFVDVLCLLLLLLAVVVSAFGGFRMRFGEVRFSLTSPTRIVIWVVALSIVRHIFARQVPIWRDLPSRLRAAWQLPDVRAAATTLISTRVTILFVGYMAVVTFGYFNERPPFRVDENEVVNLQVRWDTGWYLGIALGEYAYSEELAAGGQQNIVFFPALPVSMRIGGRLLGGTTGAFLLAGTLIVLVCFGAALIYLYRFARDTIGDDARAQYAVWLLATYPFAVFFSSIYTESIYLLGAVGAFYHFRRHELFRAGLYGLLVGLTRPNGCFLSIPLALLTLMPWIPAWLAGGPRTDVPRRDFRYLAGQLAAAAMPGIGVLLYSAFVWQLTGNPLAWAEGHIAWGRSYQGLSILITERYEYISQLGLYTYTAELPIDLLQGLGVVFVLFTLWGVFRRLGLAYAVFILVNILPPLAAGGLLSAGRFSAVLFPAFVSFAATVPERHRLAWTAAFMAVQALNAGLFYTWRGIY
jgi:hypothetical protein